MYNWVIHGIFLALSEENFWILWQLIIYEKNEN